MKTKIIILLLISFLAAVLNACKPKCKGNGGSVRYTVSDDRRFLFNRGDTLIYKTDSGLFDTLTVFDFGHTFFDYYGCVNDKLTNISIENIIIEIIDTDMKKMLRSFYIQQASFDIFLSIKVNDHFYLGVIKTGSFQHNDSIYNDVYVASNDSILLYLNQKYGIIAHQTGNEEMYHLLKYIKNTEKQK